MTKSKSGLTFRGGDYTSLPIELKGFLDKITRQGNPTAPAKEIETYLHSLTCFWSCKDDVPLVCLLFQRIPFHRDFTACAFSNALVLPSAVTVREANPDLDLDLVRTETVANGFLMMGLSGYDVIIDGIDKRIQVMAFNNNENADGSILGSINFVDLLSGEMDLMNNSPADRAYTACVSMLDFDGSAMMNHPISTVTGILAKNEFRVVSFTRTSFGASPRFDEAVNKVLRVLGRLMYVANVSIAETALEVENCDPKLAISKLREGADPSK